MLVCIPPFGSHVFVFSLEALDGLSVCSALILYMLLGAFDFLSRVCELFYRVLNIRMINAISVKWHEGILTSALSKLPFRSFFCFS